MGVGGRGDWRFGGYVENWAIEAQQLSAALRQAADLVDQQAAGRTAESERYVDGVVVEYVGHVDTWSVSLYVAHAARRGPGVDGAATTDPPPSRDEG